MYKSIIRPILFKFDPESVHHFSFSSLKLLFKLPFTKSFFRKKFGADDERLKQNIFGLEFKNPVGLAAGFDKDAKLYKELDHLGFGFIEIGTVTPVGQNGNPKKRLFRLKNDNAIINRMGFNNEGVEATVNRLKSNPGILIGGNIGKNKNTPNQEAIKDYEICFHALHDVVDYFVVNVSSPNTPNLRELQDKEPLTKLLLHLKKLNNVKEKQRPILLKIAPDLTDEQLLDIVEIVETTGIDGLIATNTTIARDGLTSANKNETGGLSGKPLAKRSTEVIKFIKSNSTSKFPIIGVGGIHSPEDAIKKLQAGASLVQLYTGFVYEGPGLIQEINKAIKNKAITH